MSEVRGAIHMYEGKDAAQEKAMLKSILDLTDIEVYDVMNHRKNLFSLDVDLPVKEIIKKSKIVRSPAFRFTKTNQKTSSALSGLKRS